MSGAGTGGPQVINPAKSPPLYVPIGMILAGLVSLVLLPLFLFEKAPVAFGPYRFNAAALTAVHLFTLGFATTIMIGAFYQIVPVMMLGRPVDGRWAAVQGLSYLIGTAGLISGFGLRTTLLIIAGGTLVVLSLTLFVILVGRSMRSATQWTISGTYMAAALSFLAGTVLWGLTLAFNLRYNFLGSTLTDAPLGAHLVLGLGGWFMLAIFGVSYQLIPMFALTSRQGERQAKVALGLLSLGLWGGFAALSLHMPAPVTALCLAAALAGVGIYGWDIGRILKRRRRPELDLGMRYVLTSFAFLVVALLLIAIGALGYTRPAVAGVWLFLPGFVGSMILGMLYKIVPFLFWHYLLKTRKEKTQRLPSLTQMYHPGLAAAGYWLWLSGTAATGLVVIADAVPHAAWTVLLSLAGSLCFVGTIIQVLRAKPLS